MSLEIVLGAITAIATAGGAGAAFGLFKAQSAEAKAQAEAESARYRYGKALEEIESLHVEEDLFCQELDGLGAGAAATIKVEFRNRVETLGFARPAWKPSRIKDEKAWVEESPHRPPSERVGPVLKKAGPLQYVVARHLDKFLSGDENAKIAPLPEPMIEPPAPLVVPAPVLNRPPVARLATPDAPGD